MMPYQHLLKLFLVFGLLMTESSSACQCGKEFSTVEALTNSEVVFSGTVTKIEKGVDRLVYFDDDLQVLLIEISVDTVWKGLIQKTVKIVTGFSNCDYMFESEKRYLIYTDHSSDLASKGLHPIICSRTKSFDLAESDLEVLGSGSAPLSGQ